MTFTTKRSRRGLLPLLIALMLVLVACSSGDDSAQSFENVADGLTAGDAATETTMAASDRTSEDAPMDDAGGDMAESEEPMVDEADGDSLGSGGITAPEVLTAADLGRDIIFTADMTIAVDDVAVAGAEATRRIQALGGFLFGQETRSEPEPFTQLVFKVFPDDFQLALDRLGDVGELRNQTISADDVTERVVDLQSRINTAVASVERLRGFLEGATDIETIADLENQLLQRETQLEQLRGQLRTIEDAVSLATIVLNIRENTIRPAVRVDVTAYSGAEDGGLSCPGSGSLTVEQGTDVTVCFEIVNVGDTNLTQFTLRDPVIDVDSEDLIPVFGDMDQTLEPGESIVVAAEITADRSWRTQTNVTALPVDEDGTVRQGRSVANTATIGITAVDPGGVPTFGEGFDSSLSALITFFQTLVYLAGRLLPFIWVPALAVWWWLRRRRPAATPVVTEENPEAPEPEMAGVTED